MKRITLLILSCCCMLLTASAQHNIARNNIWAFGNGAGIDFTTGAPVTFTSSSATWEGCASICNTGGSLLFYTDGQKVFNRLGLVMPGGSAIVPFATSSSTQGALILPFINDTTKFYVFSIENYSGTGRFTYTIVDMTLAGGLGDVVPGSMGIIINTGMSEKMIAIPGNSCNVWLMTHKPDVAEFYAYEVTAAGISATPVISSVGTFVGSNTNEIGVIKCSPDRQRIVSVSYHLGSSWGLELFDFSPATGIVSNCRLLESNPTSTFYGAEFSPDNTKLYATNNAAYQWDVSLPTTAAMIASKTSICASVSYQGDLKLGPDGKIYVSKYSATTLDRINFPNVAGVGCNYVPNFVNVAPNIARFGLPNLVWNTQSIFGASTICTGATTTYTASVAGGAWSSSNTAVAIISPTGVVTALAAGTSVISYATGGSGSCDGSATITVVAAPTLSSPSVCVGGTTGITSSTGTGTWTSGSIGVATVTSTTGAVTGVTTGTAVITYNTPGCPAATTIVTVGTLSITGGGTVCLGSALTLTGTMSGGTWTSSGSSTASVGSSTGVVTGVAGGTATISYSASVCTSTTIVTVTALSITGGTVCAGASLSLSGTIPGGTWVSGSTSTATIVSSSGVLTGIAAGTVEITYSAVGCTNTTIVTVNPGAPPTGSSVCTGATTTLTGSVPGGTWNSSNIAVATVGLSSGVVTGIASGTSAITYLNPASCMEITIVTVNATPGPIGGKFALCETFSTVLNCTPAGGAWSTGSPNATINTTGLVTGVTAGTAVVTYTIAGGCYSTAIVSVNPLPAPILGTTTVVAGSTITLTDATPGGSWTSGDSTKALPDGTGVITGMAPGTTTIYYTLPTGCKQKVVVAVSSKNTVTVASIGITKPMLYPNPATNEITIKTEQAAFTSFTIYNAVGQVVATHDITSPEMKVGVKTFPPGEYQVVFKGDGIKDIVRFTKW